MVDHQGEAPFVVICHFSSIAQLLLLLLLIVSHIVLKLQSVFCIHCKSWLLFLLASHTDSSHAVH